MSQEQGQPSTAKRSLCGSAFRAAYLRQGAAHLEGGCCCSPGHMGRLGVSDSLLKDLEILPVLCTRAGSLCSALSNQQPARAARAPRSATDMPI